MIGIKCSAFKGFFFAMLDAVLFCCASAAMKMITSLHPAQLSLYRFIALFVMSMPETVKCREHPFGPKEDRINLIVRGVFGGIALFLAYTAYRYLPLGEASVIIYSTPISVTVAARIFLKEPCSIFQCVLVVISVIGVIFTTKLPMHLIGDSVVNTNECIYGFLSAIGSFLCRTVQAICIRKSKEVHHAVMVFNYGWVAIIEGLILMAILADYKLHECGADWIYILSLGFFSYCAQNFMTLALKCDYAGPIITVFSAASIIISFFLQIFLFHESTDAYTIIGAVLVGSCIVGAGLNKLVSHMNFRQLKMLRWLKTE